MVLQISTLIFLLASAACTATRAPVALPSWTCPETLDAGDLFESEGLEGVFVLRDETTGCIQTTNAQMARSRFCPQSTFKIPNALIGLETGVIKGGPHTWKWDGIPRRIHDWEQDLNLGQALKVSCVPCFQDVARRIGETRMRRYLHDFGYGNQDISGPIDQFWLDGPLRISPVEQVEFIHRLLRGTLPIKPEHVELVWRLLEIESGPDYHVRGKTGLGTQDGRAIGWLVGMVERGEHRWIYATFVQSRPGLDIKAEMNRLVPLRKRITRELLTRAKVLPATSELVGKRAN